MSRKQRVRDKRTHKGPKYYFLIFFRDPSTQQKSFYTNNVDQNASVIKQL